MKNFLAILCGIAAISSIYILMQAMHQNNLFYAISGLSIMTLATVVLLKLSPEKDEQPLIDALLEHEYNIVIINKAEQIRREEENIIKYEQELLAYEEKSHSGFGHLN